MRFLMSACSLRARISDSTTTTSVNLGFWTGSQGLRVRHASLRGEILAREEYVDQLSSTKRVCARPKELTQRPEAEKWISAELSLIQAQSFKLTPFGTLGFNHTNSVVSAKFSSTASAFWKRLNVLVPYDLQNRFQKASVFIENHFIIRGTARLSAAASPRRRHSVQC